MRCHLFCIWPYHQYLNYDDLLNANNVKSPSEFPMPNWSSTENGCALNGISLDLFPMIGSKTAPDPFPPVIPIDTTLSISKVRGSI